MRSTLKEQWELLFGDTQVSEADIRGLKESCGKLALGVVGDFDTIYDKAAYFMEVIYVYKSFRRRVMLVMNLIWFMGRLDYSTVVPGLIPIFMEKKVDLVKPQRQIDQLRPKFKEFITIFDLESLTIRELAERFLRWIDTFEDPDIKAFMWATFFNFYQTRVFHIRIYNMQADGALPEMIDGNEMVN